MIKKSVAIKKLKADKKYYVRIRTRKKVGGRKYCSAWNKVSVPYSTPCEAENYRKRRKRHG